MAKNFGDRHRNLIGLLIVSFILLLAWAFFVPIFEAPDEPHHWYYARYLHQNWRLPVYSQELIEANSPPLYYLFVAPFASDSAEPKAIITNASTAPVSPRPPRWFDDSSKDFNKYWPIRWARIVSVLISTLTVLFCYKLGVETTRDESTGLLVGGIVAFLPQFSFRGMNVSNDALVTMLCAAATYFAVRLIKRGFTWYIGILTAIVSGLAFLSKTNAIFLPVPLSLALINTQGTWMSRLGRLSVLGLTLLIVAPWLIRNQILYGDPLASRIMLTVVAHIVDVKPITSTYFVTIFPKYLFFSFVGFFGWMNLRVPNWLYLFYGFVAIMAILGYIWRGFKRQMDGWLTLVLLTFPLLSLMVTIYINLKFSQPQGRYLFPALGAIALLLGLGLEGLPFWSKQSTYYLLGILFFLNLYILGTVIIPAYWL